MKGGAHGPLAIQVKRALDGARFKRPVSPGDQLIIKVELTRSMRGVFKFKAIVEVDGQLAAEAELMCTVKSVA